MNRKLIYALVFLTATVLVTLAAGFLVLGTEAGSRWLIQSRIDQVAPQLSITTVKGSVLSGLRISGIEYATQDVRIRIKAVELKCRPMKLLSGRLHFSKATFDDVAVSMLSQNFSLGEDTAKLLERGLKPFELELAEASLKRLAFRKGNITQTIDQARFSLQAGIDGLNFKRLAFEKSGFHTDLEARIETRYPHRFSGALLWQTTSTAGTDASGSCKFNGDANMMNFRHTLIRPVLIKASGQLHLRDLIAQGRIAKNVNMAPAIANPCRREVTGSNTSNPYQMGLIGNIAGRYIPATNFQFCARNDDSGIRFDNLNADVLGATVEAAGRIDWQQDPAWKFTISAVDLNPAKQWPLWRGRFGVKGTIRGKMQAGKITLNLDDLMASGFLLDRPFEAAANLHIENEKMAIQNLSIHSGQTTLVTAGTASLDNIDLVYDLDARDPAGLWTGINGHIHSKGSVTGSFKRPVLAFSTVGQNMYYGRYRVETLKANGQIELSADKTPFGAGTILIRNLSVNNETFPKILLNFKGKFTDHRVRASIQHRDLTADIAAAGKCLQESCSFELDSASFALGRDGTWQLIQPIRIQMGHLQIDPFESCWQKQSSSLCLRAAHHTDWGWQTDGDINSKQLHRILALLQNVFDKKNLGWEKVAQN